MTRRPGFALPAVLGALILMGMLVAVGAQRALVAAHDGALAEARAQLAAVTETALADALARGPDSLAMRVTPPGGALDSGVASVGTASARWRLTVALAPVVLLSIDAAAPVRAGSARVSWRLWLRRRDEPSGVPAWSANGTGWWTQIPLP
ncbi:MAG: hypothetical protein ACYC3L_13920 [Gemmatimonadaceae bacterium]